MGVAEIRDAIRDINDFPKKGIVFKDITPVLQNTALFRISIDILAERCMQYQPDVICGIESRGFIFGAAIAYKLGLGFVPVRKPGKLPYDTYKKEYSLEYGTNTLEVHKDAFKKDTRVLLIDDLLATGGTVKAAAELVEACDATVVGMLFLVELAFLEGREIVSNYNVDSVITY